MSNKPWIKTKRVDDKTLDKKWIFGDTLEIIIPHKIEPVEFIIEQLWDSNTEEKINTINPGKQGQTVKLKLPIQVEANTIIRRKKTNKNF